MKVRSTADAARETARELRRGDDLREPTGADMKIEPRTWTDERGRKLFVDVPRLWDDNTFTACVGTGNGPEPALPMIDFMPQANFAAAQRALDAIGTRKLWQPDPPMPEDDPNPAPVRRSDQDGLTGGRRPGPEKVEQANIDVGLIDPSPFQPRTNFDAASLATLAKTILADGQSTPIAVRRKGDRYELIDGERRLRAIRENTGLTTIRAEIRDRTDAQVRADIAHCALQRENLNPLETARTYQLLLDSGDCRTQEDVAGKCGVTQGQVANTIGLLRLPADPWHGWIADGTLTAAHARAIAPWSKYPKVLEMVGKEMQRGDPMTEDPDDDQTMTVDALRDVVTWAVRAQSEQISGSRWNAEVHASIPNFAPTDADRSALDIVRLNGEERAMNVGLWKKLQAKHVRAWIKEHKANQEAKEESRPAGKKGLKSGASSRKPPKEKPLSDEQRAEKKEQWLVDSARWLIAQQAGSLDNAKAIRILLAVTLLADDDVLMLRDLAEAIDTKFGTRVRAMFGDKQTTAVLQRLLALDASELSDCVRNLIAAAFWDRGQGGPRSMFWGSIGLRMTAAIAAAVGIDLAAAWQDGTLAPHYGAYLNLCTDAELHALAGALKISVVMLNRDHAIAAIAKAMPAADSKELGPALPKDLATIWKKAQKL